MGLHFSGLRKKVLKNFFIITVLVVLAFEVIFMLFISVYYYSSVNQILISQVNYTNGVYNSPEMEEKKLSEKIISIYDKNNTSRNALAVSIIDKNNRLIIDQYGIKSFKLVNYVDVKEAFANKSNMTPYTYTEEDTGERVMSIAVPLKENGNIIAVARYSASLQKIDAEIFNLAVNLLIFGLFILMISVFLSFKFANGVIFSLAELKEFSNKMAKGYYDIKIDPKKISDDEIGDLAKTFENMASEIQKNEKLKDEFISSVSHELRTPLTSIKGWSETLKLENISKDETDLGLGIIQDETERLINLVEELLDFSRLSSDRIKFKMGELNVETLVVGVVNQLRVKAVEKNIKLSFKFINEKINTIQGDKNRLRQVLINLIQNSLKFTPNDGSIDIIVSQDEEYTKIIVSDTGIGIEEQNLKNVRNKFFQEDYNKSGSGLGLAISDEIVRHHGGYMEINSKKNKGTVITIVIKNKLIL